MIIDDKTCLSAPGLLGEIISYIEENAIYPQPSLALAAALSLLSVLKGQRVQSQTGLRTNLLAVGLAPSGAGKGYGMKKIEKLLEACELPHLLAGKPASHTGLLESLASTGRKLICWDEFGIALSIISNPKAPFYKAGIMQVLMDTYSKADSYYRGDEYKNGDGKTRRADIRYPNLSIYGLSTPDRFFESLQSANVIDGFLPRLLIFEGKSGDGSDRQDSFKAHEKIFKGSPIRVPAGLVKRVRAEFPSGNLSSLSLDTAEAKILPFSKEAEGLHLHLFEKAEKLKAEAPSPAARAVASRYFENLIKLCLVAEKSVDAIQPKTMFFCEKIMDALIDTSFRALETKIHDSLVSKEVSRLTDIIASFKDGGISKRDLTRRTSWLRPHERKALIETLVEGERIETFRKQVTDSQKTSVFYRVSGIYKEPEINGLIR